MDQLSAKSQILCVASFHDLVSSPFDAGINAFCWKRELAGDLSESVDRIKLNENLETVSEQELNELEVSEQGKLVRETFAAAVSRKTISLIISLLIFSCSNHQDKKLENGIPCEDPTIPIKVFSSSISSSKYIGQEFPTCFESAFSDSTVLVAKTECGTNFYSFQTINIGKINIESGKIIACDPIVLRDAVAFMDVFPTGYFDVQLAITQDSSRNGRVAFSRILFSNEPVYQWKYAVRDNQRGISVIDTTVFLDCHPVDGGQGLFIDRIAAEKFNLLDQKEWSKAFSNSKWYKSDFFGSIHKFENYSLATFATGHGDGCYGSFIGLDRSGNICRLLTDFQMVIWWKRGSA